MRRLAGRRGGTAARRRRPSRPRNTSQKPRSPKASASAQGAGEDGPIEWQICPVGVLVHSCPPLRPNGPPRTERRRASGVVDGRGEEAERGEDGPARPPRRVCDQDEDDRDDEDDREVEVALVEPVVDRHSDEQPSDEVEPERGRLVDDGSRGEVEQADEESHDVRPPAAVRDEVGDEEPADDGRDEPMNGNRQIQRKTRAATRIRELEREVRQRPALERRAPAVEPAEPVPGRPDEEAPGDQVFFFIKGAAVKAKIPAASHLSATRSAPATNNSTTRMSSAQAVCAPPPR